MAITDFERFSIYPAIFDALTIPDVVNVTPSAAIQKMVVTPGGALDPGLIALVSLDPVATLSAVGLGAVLTGVSPTVGLAVSTLAKIQLQARADGGAFQSGSNHVTMSSTKGMLIPESIQAQQDDQNPALIQLKYYGLKSGSNPPMQINVAQALSGSPAVAAAYKLGPVVIDGVILGGVQRSQLNFGLTYQTKRANGDTAPSVGSITKRAATGEITAGNFSLANAGGFGLTACVVGITAFFLRSDQLPASSTHLAVTSPAGSTYELAEVPGQGDQDAETRLMITAAGPLTINTTAAYPS